MEMRLVRDMQSKIVDFKNLIVNQHNQLQRENPIDRIIRYKEQQLYLKNRLNSSILQKLENLQKKYLSLTQTLNAVSPLATLERGYAIVNKPDTPVVIRSSQQLSLNDMITTRFARGQIISQIKEINHE
jgi:exodeoxyribonuclease VII large subunit